MFIVAPTRSQKNKKLNPMVQIDDLVEPTHERACGWDLEQSIEWLLLTMNSSFYSDTAVEDLRRIKTIRLIPRVSLVCDCPESSLPCRHYSVKLSDCFGDMMWDNFDMLADQCYKVENPLEADELARAVDRYEGLITTFSYKHLSK
jgi:hypothetical protein